MGYFSKIASFPVPYYPGVSNSSLVVGTKVYVEEGGRLWEWDGVSNFLVLVADASTDSFPGVTNIMLSMCEHLGEIWGASENGCMYKWNGLSPAVSKGGLGAWTRMAGSCYEELLSIVSFGGEVLAGTGTLGRLLAYNPMGGFLVRASQFLSQSKIHFLVEVSGELYGSTGDNAHLFKWDGVSSWVDKTSDTISIAAQTAVVSLFEDSGDIYGGSYPDNYLLKWDGATKWLPLVSIPPSSLDSSGIKSMLFYEGKIWGVSEEKGILFSFDESSWEMSNKAYSADASPVSGMFLFNDKLYTSGDGIYLFVDAILDKEGIQTILPRRSWTRDNFWQQAQDPSNDIGGVLRTYLDVVNAAAITGSKYAEGINILVPSWVELSKFMRDEIDGGVLNSWWDTDFLSNFTTAEYPSGSGEFLAYGDGIERRLTPVSSPISGNFKFEVGCQFDDLGLITVANIGINIRKVSDDSLLCTTYWVSDGLLEVYIGSLFSQVSYPLSFGEKFGLRVQRKGDKLYIYYSRKESSFTEFSISGQTVTEDDVYVEIFGPSAYLGTSYYQETLINPGASREWVESVQTFSERGGVGLPNSQEVV